MSRFLFIILLYFGSISVIGQSNLLVEFNDFPAIEFDLCEDQIDFKVKLTNLSVINDIDSLNFELLVPTGLYIDAVVNNTGGKVVTNSNSLNRVSFSAVKLDTLESVEISLLLRSDCDAIDYLNNGGDLQIAFNGNYLVNQLRLNAQKNSSSFILKQATLGFVGYTNQSYIAQVNDIYQRCFTIRNNGNAKVSSFVFTDLKGSDIEINSVLVNGNNTPFISRNDSIILMINTPLLPGASITICEMVEVKGCADVDSEIGVTWGCNRKVCQQTSTFANTTFQDLAPDIQLTHSSKVGTCYGPNSPDTMSLELENIGDNAYNVDVVIRHGWGNYANPNNYWHTYSFIDTNTIRILDARDGNVINVPYTITQTWHGRRRSCNVMDSISGFQIHFDTILAGTQFFISWEVTKCCFSDMNDRAIRSGWRRHYIGWVHGSNYENHCGQMFSDPVRGSWVGYNVLSYGQWQNRQRVMYHRQNLNVNQAVINNVQGCNVNTVSNNDQVAISFFINNSESFVPTNENADFYKFDFVLPSCMDYLPSSGNGIWVIDRNLNRVNPVSTTIIGDTVRALFDLPGNPPMLPGATRRDFFDKSEIWINTQVNCANCGNVNDTNYIEIFSYLIPDSINCNCSLAQAREEFPIVFNCQPCNQTNDLTFTDFCINRENYGLPDNNDDGIPDATGTIDLNRIRRERVMVGDTILSTFSGQFPFSSTVYGQFNYIYAVSTIENGAYIKYHNSDISITDFTTNVTYTAENVNLPCVINNGANNSRTFYTEFDLNQLNNINFTPALPANFQLDGFDRFTISPRLVVHRNIGNSIRSSNVESRLYATNVQNVDSVVSECDGYDANINLIGYYLYSWRSGTYPIDECGNFNIHQNFYMSIGNCCNNYAGGNIFPYEYRNWGVPDTFYVETDYNYNFIDARVRYWRSQGYSGRDCGPLSPVSIVGSQNQLANGRWRYTFDVGKKIDGINCLPSDDGFHGQFVLTLSPNCQVLDEPDTVDYIWNFDLHPQLDSTEIFPQARPGRVKPFYEDDDIIDFNPPNFFIQSLLPNIQTENNEVSWEVWLSNTSNRTVAENVWIANRLNQSSINITSITNLNTGIPLTLNNDIYELDVINVNPGELIKFRIDGIINGCDLDSIRLAFGWDCNGFPLSLTDYDTIPCNTQEYTLTATPLEPAFSIVMQASKDSADLCEEVEYTLEIENVLIGTAIDPQVNVLLPQGVEYVVNTTSVKYPNNTSFTNTINPRISGSALSWNLNDLSPYINQNGMVGVFHKDSNIIQLKFKLKTNCSYQPGRLFDTYVRYNRASCDEVDSIYSNIKAVFIKGIQPDYQTTIDIIALDDIRPCLQTTSIRVEVTNNGPQATNIDDTLFVKLPKGMDYFPNSYIPTTNGVNFIGTKNEYGFNYLIVRLPVLAVGDKISIEFDMEAVSIAEIKCGVNEIYAFQTTTVQALCNTTLCNINPVVGDNKFDILSNKSILQLSNNQSFSSFFDVNNEEGFIKFDILNLGEPIAAGHQVYVNYYRDIDNNGRLSFADTIVRTKIFTGNINTNATYSFMDTMIIPGDLICDLIAVIDLDDNPCLCNSTEIKIEFDNEPLQDSDTICSRSSQNIHIIDSVSNYQYSWSPNKYINNPNLANPQFNVDTNINAPITLEYYVTTNKGDCQDIDTVYLYVIPRAISNGNFDTVMCDNNSFVANALALPAPYQGTWTFASGIQCSNINDENTSFTNLSYDTNYLYWNIFNPICNISTQDTFMVINYENPTVTLNVKSTTICETDSARLIANYTPTKSTLRWYEDSINNPVLSNISNVNNPNQTIGYNQSGQYKYYIETINGICVNLDSVIVDVVEQASANILTPLSSSVFCVGDNIDLLAQASTQSYHTPQWRWLPPTSTMLNNPNQYSLSIGNLTKGNYGVIFSISDVNNVCDIVEDTVEFTIQDKPEADFTISPNLICAEECITLIDLSKIDTTGGNSINDYWWVIDGDTIKSTTDSVTYCPLNNGTYTIDYIINTNNNCKDTTSKIDILGVNPKPKAQFEINPADNIVTNTNIDFNDLSSTDVISWVYYYGNGDSSLVQNSRYAYTEPNDYTVIQIVDNGSCTDTFTLDITVHPSFVVFAPNSFTPNGDGFNETFKIEIKGEQIDTYELYIYDRWGTEVMKSKDKNEVWDGTYQGNLVPSANYVWRLKCKAINSKDTRVFSGHVIVIY